jgi:hypothetical protein
VLFRNKYLVFRNNILNLYYRKSFKYICTTDIQKGEDFEMNKRIKPIRAKGFWA